MITDQLKDSGIETYSKKSRGSGDLRTELRMKVLKSKNKRTKQKIKGQQIKE